MLNPKTRTPLSLLITAASLACGAGLHAALLKVDLGNSGSSPAGFSLWDPTGPNNNVGLPLVTADFAGLHLALNASNIADIGTAPAVDGNGDLMGWSNGIITRSRAAIGSTGNGSMYQDFVTAAAGGTVGLQISGLSANTAYALTFYSFDENGSRTSIFRDYTGGANNALGNITYSNPSGAGSGNPTSDTQYALNAIMTTDALGRLTIGETQQGGIAPVLNGFEIATTIEAVPEPKPAGIALIMLGLAMVGSRFRRQGIVAKA